MLRAIETTRGRLVLLLTAVAVVLPRHAPPSPTSPSTSTTASATALWSATLHLLDPSSLHEDEGGAQRAIGVFQVITGLVLLVGLLFTFVAEVVTRSLERLGQSDRPVTCRDHLLVVGGRDLVALAFAAATEAHRETELEAAGRAGARVRTRVAGRRSSTNSMTPPAASSSTSSSATPPATRASSSPGRSGRGRSC